MNGGGPQPSVSIQLKEETFSNTQEAAEVLHSKHPEKCKTNSTWMKMETLVSTRLTQKSACQYTSIEEKETY